jgi:hypothetical protein
MLLRWHFSNVAYHKGKNSKKERKKETRFRVYMKNTRKWETTHARKTDIQSFTDLYFEPG